MSGRTKSGALRRALCALVPATDIHIIHERPWHSLTYSGTQLCFAMDVVDPTRQDLAAYLTSMLAEYEFDVPGQIVADIAITHAVVAGSTHHLIIDALLLDD